LLFGQNPGGGGPNAGLHRAGLRNLDWLVVLDWFETESAVFWKDDPKGPPSSDIKTEVFFIPAASSPEKDGTLTNTQRLLQWHNKAIDPPGDCRSDAWFVYQLGKRLQTLYAGSTDPRDQGLLHLTWNYDFDEPQRLPDGTRSRIADEPDLEKVLQEINGFWAASTRLGTTARLPAAAGYIPVFSLSPAAIAPASVSSLITHSSRTGVSPGPPIAASCTTAPPPIPKAGRGRNARN
jgi:anaerobic selenocysteine-containing dehydrogenase